KEDVVNDYSFTNFASLFRFITQKYDKEDFLNYLKDGQWVSLSTKDFEKKVIYLSLALKDLGIGKNTSVAIVSDSSPFWIIVDFAIQIAGGNSVPLFTKISSSNLQHEIEDANVQFLFLGDGKRASEFDRFQFKKVFTTEISTTLKNQTNLTDLFQIGEKIHLKDPLVFDSMINEVKDEDLLSIIYTSGNTGVPKGVELTHKNVITQLHDIKKNFPVDETDRALSVLPLAHIFERAIMTFYLSCGVSIYFADDVKNAGMLLKDVKPTIITVVPRLLEKIYFKMKAKIEDSPIVNKLIGTLARVRAIHKNPDSEKAFYDKLFEKIVYKKFKEAFGGNIKLLVCGGSALDVDLYKFFLNIGLPLYQGYGMTEFSPVISANNPKQTKWGTCGVAFPSATIKIAEDGEVLVKGDSMMRGYHNLEDKTKETIIDGWLHTGDLGTMDKDGFLTIQSRKKELFKTSNGKYVNPIIIEQGIVKSPLIDFAVVIADNKNFTSALLFPDFDYFESYIAEHPKLPDNYTIEDFFAYKKIHKTLKKHMKRVNRDLNQWEKIKEFRIVYKRLSIEDGDITPSMKLRRNEIEKKYADVIKEIYKEEEL
ncbi:MAG: long-chain fatty acid--CoA ligase, partial [Campylobacterales bacterium]|nr:long-chain fatty acid--CoA ligase [Campylobacterales bacterium]